MKYNNITPEEQAMLNKDFGRRIAEWMYQEGITKCPIILNSEQADALRARWKELSKKE